jgi:hypothetical protein
MSALDWSLRPEPWRSIGLEFVAELDALAKGQEPERRTRFIRPQPRIESAWPLDDKLALVTLWNASPPITEAEIGRKLGGRSRSAISAKAHRMGLPSRPPGAPRRER